MSLIGRCHCESRSPWLAMMRYRSPDICSHEQTVLVGREMMHPPPMYAAAPQAMQASRAYSPPQGNVDYGSADVTG
eukprot:4440361-Amphidinium_carterae.1